LLNDSAHYTEIFAPPGSGRGYWNGAPTILKDGDTYYLVHRLRGGDTLRGYQLECHSSTDLVNWTLEWTVHKDDIVNETVTSFEKICLRKFGGYYYLYFTYDRSSQDWKTSFVKSTTIAGLESLLKDATNWTVLFGGGYCKDPTVFELNGTYYISAGTIVGVPSRKLYSDDNPEFSSPTEIVDFRALYVSKWGAPDAAGDTGIITYDESSGYFIFQGHYRDDTDDIYWWYAVSPDMKEWRAVQRDKEITNWDNQWNTARYWDYVCLDDQRIIIVMEWDHDGDLDNSVVIWDYSDDPPGSTLTKMQDDFAEHVFLNEHCRTDFGDIRFTKSDGVTELDYWMEEKVDGDYAVFWVEVADDLSTESQTIYIYYGKSDATTTSNGEDTFVFFKGFEDGTTQGLTVTVGAWEAFSEGAPYGYVLRQISLTANSRAYWDTPETPSNFVLEGFGKRNTAGDKGAWSVALKKGDELYRFPWEAAGTIEIEIIDSWASWTTITTLASTAKASHTNWFKFSVKYYEGKMTFFLEDTTVSVTDSTLTPPFEIGVWCGKDYYKWDDLRVRKYVDPEPSHGAWGAEESV